VTTDVMAPGVTNGIAHWAWRGGQVYAWPFFIFWWLVARQGWKTGRDGAKAKTGELWAVPEYGRGHAGLKSGPVQRAGRVPGSGEVMAFLSFTDAGQVFLFTDRRNGSARQDHGDDDLSNMPGRTFQDRQQASIDAKAKMLERFKARPAEDDPTIARLRAERQAVVEARKVREAEREAEKEAARKLAAEKAAIEKAAREEAERKAAAEREAARIAEEARILAEAPRKSLMDAVQYMQQRAAGKGRR